MADMDYDHMPPLQIEGMSQVKAVRRKKLFARKKARALKEGSLAALRSIKTAGAQRAIEEAGRTGDRMLKKLVRETGAGT